MAAHHLSADRGWPLIVGCPVFVVLVLVLVLVLDLVFSENPKRGVEHEREARGRKSIRADVPLRGAIPARSCH